MKLKSNLNTSSSLVIFTLPYLHPADREVGLYRIRGEDTPNTLTNGCF